MKFTDKTFKSCIDVLCDIYDITNSDNGDVIYNTLDNMSDYIEDIREVFKKCLGVVETHMDRENKKSQVALDSSSVRRNDLIRLFKMVMKKNEYHGEKTDIHMPKSGKSGFSVGLFQWDMSTTNQHAVSLATFISKYYAKQYGGRSRDILNAITTTTCERVTLKDNGFLSNDEVLKIELASKVIDRFKSDLEDDPNLKKEFYTKVFEAENESVELYFKRLDELLQSIVMVDGQSKKPLTKTTFFKLFLLDYHNQFNISIGGKMAKALTTNTFKTLKDIIEYQKTLTYYRNGGGNDLLRRLANIIEVCIENNLDIQALGVVEIVGDNFIEYVNGELKNKPELTNMRRIKELLYKVRSI